MGVRCECLQAYTWHVLWGTSLCARSIMLLVDYSAEPVCK